MKLLTLQLSLQPGWQLWPPIRWQRSRYTWKLEIELPFMVLIVSGMLEGA